MRLGRFGRVKTLAALLLCFTMAQAQETTPPVRPPTEEKPAAQAPAEKRPRFTPPWEGSLAFRLRMKRNSDEADSDLHTYLSLERGTAAEDDVTVHLFGRASQDLDGSDDPAFRGITNTSTGSLSTRLYTAHIDYHRIDPFSLVRLGRQYDYETPLTLHYDGVRFDTEEFPKTAHLQGGIYGGVPVHLDEASNEGDLVWGAYARTDPWEGGRARVDVVRIRDSALLGTEWDSLIGLGFRQGIEKHGFVRYQHSILDSHSRDFLAQGSWHETSLDLTADATYSGLLETQTMETTDNDYFFSALGQYHPYREYRLMLSKGFGGDVTISGGGNVRVLKDEQDEGTFNHEFRHYFLTPSVQDFPWKGLSLSVTGEVWDNPGTDSGDIRTYGADLRYKASKEMTLSASSTYALYRYDYFTNLEKENIRTYQIRMIYSVEKDVKVDVGYEYEDGEIDDFRVWKTGVTILF